MNKRRAKIMPADRDMLGRHLHRSSAGATRASEYHDMIPDVNREEGYNADFRMSQIGMIALYSPCTERCMEDIHACQAVSGGVRGDDRIAPDHLTSRRRKSSDIPPIAAASSTSQIWTTINAPLPDQLNASAMGTDEAEERQVYVTQSSGCQQLRESNILQRARSLLLHVSQEQQMPFTSTKQEHNWTDSVI